MCDKFLAYKTAARIDMTEELSLLVAGERGLKMKQDFDSMKEK